MEVIKFDEMKKMWSEISRYKDGSIPPNFELKIYKKMLEIFHIGEYYHYILNIADDVKMEFVSDNITNILGIHPEDFTAEYIFENMHPDDTPRFAIHEQKVADFFMNLPPEKVLKYKVSYDYRLRTKNGNYKWILMQTTTIQSDENGAVIRVLGVQTDITHLKTENKPSGLSFLGLEGEPSYYNVPIDGMVFLPSEEIFSPKEKEILKLVIEGKTTKEIAEILCKSVHTVNSHRKNIFQKTDSKTVAELAVKCVRNNWI